MWGQKCKPHLCSTTPFRAEAASSHSNLDFGATSTASRGGRKFPTGSTGENWSGDKGLAEIVHTRPNLWADLDQTEPNLAAQASGQSSGPNRAASGRNRWSHPGQTVFPRSAPIPPTSPRVDRNRSECGRQRPTFARHRSKQAKEVQIWPSSARSWPMQVQIWSASPKRGRIPPEFDQKWSEMAQTGTNWVAV